jgi:glycosyltransferase involved in cell wall biosynthesis
MYTIHRKSQLSNPKLTVVVPCYNQESYIIDCLDSIVSQKVDFAFDIVVVDDASTDQTLSHILNHVGLLKCEATVISFNVNQFSQGRIPVVSVILDMVTSEYVAFLDGDDIWLDDEKLRIQVSLLDRFPQASIVCSDVVRFVGLRPPSAGCQSDETTMKVLRLSDLLIANSVMTCTTMFRRNALLPLGLWSESVLYLDYLMTLLSMKNGNFTLYDDRKLSAYRISQSGVHSHLMSKPYGMHQIQINAQHARLSFVRNGGLTKSDLIIGLLSLVIGVYQIIESSPLVIVTRSIPLRVFRRFSKLKSGDRSA